MNDVTEAICRLAGVSNLQIRLGLSDSEIAELCNRITAARSEAQMTANQFVAMDRAARISFCASYGFSRVEVRFAQRIAAVMRASAASSRVAACLVRMRRQNGERRVSYQ